VPERVVPVGVGGEPGDHRLAQIPDAGGQIREFGVRESGVDHEHARVALHDGGRGLDDLALVDEHAVGDLLQHQRAFRIA
jgi:hypothetical protein